MRGTHDRGSVLIERSARFLGMSYLAVILVCSYDPYQGISSWVTEHPGTLSYVGVALVSHSDVTNHRQGRYGPETQHFTYK